MMDWKVDNNSWFGYIVEKKSLKQLVKNLNLRHNILGRKYLSLFSCDTIVHAPDEF